MKYAFIRQNRHFWPIRVQCRVLGVSVAGYHEHFGRQRTMTPRRYLSEEALLVHIRAIYVETRGAYGWPRKSNGCTAGGSKRAVRPKMK